MDFSTDELTAKYQWTIANRLSTTCPPASRFYLSNLERKLISKPKLLKKEVKRTFLYCNHCGSLWSPGNHRVRVYAPPSANCHIKKLIKYETEQPWKLNSRQKKKLKKFRESTSKIVYVCNVCKKTTTFPGIQKYGKNEKNITFSTSVPKIRYKKGDLNAGLFIKTPTENMLNAKVTKDPKEADSEIPSIAKILELPTIEVRKPDIKVTHNKPTLTQELSSSKKRKKSLLTQILNQEQETKKKKNSLSSFLISL